MQTHSLEGECGSARFNMALDKDVEIALRVIGGLLEGMMGAFGEVAGVFAETTGGEVSGEVADTAGNVVADQNTLNHIFGNPEHGFDAFLCQFGGSSYTLVRHLNECPGDPDTLRISWQTFMASFV